jgi:protein-glutamine gamma-glutamyltransferase
MTLERYFKLSSYALLGTGTAMLVATRQLDLVSLLLFAAVLVIACLIDCGVWQWWEPKRWVNWLVPAWLPIAVADWYLLDSTLPAITMRFLLFTVALRLLRNKSERDWRWLYTVSFMQVLFAAGLMIDTLFLVLLVVYLFAALSTLVSFELQRAAHSFDEHQHSQLTQTEFWREPRRPKILGGQRRARKTLGAPRWHNVTLFAGLALLLIFVLAAPLFFVMPRVARAFPNNFMRGEALSGFSENVRLGEVARIKLNPQVVMRVRVKFPPLQPRQWLRWRGLALDKYENGNWSRSLPPPRRQTDVGGGNYFVSQRRAYQLPTEQEFFLEPLNSGIIFAAPRAWQVSGLDTLQSDADYADALWTDPHAFYRFHYEVFSDTGEVPTEQLQADTSRLYSEEYRRLYLQLPEDRDRRLDKLAETITRGATSPYEMAQRIEQHLQDSYQYTLDLQEVEHGDPVCDFLFNVKAGHCEYFASAMVLLLRTRGIPARLVNGFQMGEYSELADAYTVRQADAHSWVEAYFPKSKWVAFDPTPDAGLNVYDNGWLSWLRHYGDAMQMFWQERVVGFDAGEQLSMLMTAQRKLAYWRYESSTRWLDWRKTLNEWLAAWSRPANHTVESPAQSEPQPTLTESSQTLFWHPVTQFLLASLTSGLALFLWQRYRRSWRYRFRQDPARSAIAFYQELLDTLARAGKRRAPEQTPQEFAAQLRWPQVTELTSLYQRARFGKQGLSEGEITRATQLLRELRSVKPGKVPSMAK